MAAIFVAVIIAWVTEVIPISVTALLIGPALVAADITDAKTAFAPYADPLLFLFVGGFFIARAMTRHGLDRRIAEAMVALPFVANRAPRVRATLMVTGVALSMWISNTASTAILLPILLGLLPSERDPATDRAATGSVLTIAYASSVGGIGTLVGTPPNAIAARFIREAGVDFGFVDWLKIGIPVSLALALLIYLTLDRTHRPLAATAGVARGDRGAFTRGERVTALAFSLAVLGWVLPGVLKSMGVPGSAAIAEALPSGAVALIAASVLFFFRDDERELVLPWDDAAKIDWGIIFLFGGGISLGVQMVETGLANVLSRGFLALTGVNDLWMMTALLIVFTIFFTEVCSNTASSNMITPLAISLAGELGVSPLPPALGVALAASCAFMLPIATGPNAIAYGTGRVPLPSMMGMGVILNLLAAPLIFVLLRVLCPLYGWD